MRITSYRSENLFITVSKAFSGKEEFSATMVKSRAQALKSYRGMPMESRNVRNLDPRKMLKGFLISKISAYRYQIRKVENEVEYLKVAVTTQKLNQSDSEMINEKVELKERRLERMIKYLHALEARKDGALNDDPIFAEWGIDTSILSTLSFDGDNIPAAGGHYTVTVNGDKKQSVAKKVQTVKVSSAIDFYRNQKVAAHSFPTKQPLSKRLTKNKFFLKKKEADEKRKKLDEDLSLGIRRSARLRGVDPLPITDPSVEKDEVYMNKDAERVKASKPFQPVSRAFNLVDTNPRLIYCCISDDEANDEEVWNWWLDNSGNQDPELHVFHPNVVRFARKVFKTDDLTRAMLIDSSLRLYYLKPETPFHYVPEPIASSVEMYPLIQNIPRSIEFYPGMDEIRLCDGEIETPDLTVMLDFTAAINNEANIMRCESYEKECTREKFFDPDVFMNDMFMNDLFAYFV